MYANEFKTKEKQKLTEIKKQLQHTHLPTLPFNVGLTGSLGPHYLVNTR